MIRVTELIFTTPHGSRLYGWHHENSDHDIFEVTTSTRSRARQTVSYAEGTDKVSVGLDTYLRRVREGSHQAVEALFSPYKVWGSSPEATYFRPYLSSLRVQGADVFAAYERTIKRFCHGEFKQRRHAVRLALNLSDLRSEGRFNPVMSPFHIQWATRLAESTLSGEELWKTLM